MIRIFSTLLALFFAGTAFGQKNVAMQIAALHASGKQPKEAALLQYRSNDVQNRAFEMEGLTQGTILSLNQEDIQSLFALPAKSDFIKVSIPVTERSNMNLILMQHNIFTEEFALYTSDSPGVPADYMPGIHYKGIIEGEPNSVVALSVFNNQVMGLISSDDGNVVIGPISNDRDNQHVLYNDKDLDRLSDFACGTLDDGIGYTEEQLKEAPQNRDAGDCVRLYIEIDDDIVTQKGGATNATNFITGLFNQVIVMYNNDAIGMSINEIYAWTTNSPYTGGTSSAMLSSYQANTGSFNGDLSHLVSYNASGGIAAGFNGICNSNPDLSKCFSSIDGAYSNVPTYSWDVMVTTHEMGHLIGSRHTHACVWNGNNTAIDGCAGSVEGNCPLPGYPSGGGTIMSYCHLQNVGINFTLGFGPQPGNVVRNTVNANGNCLSACGPPPPPPPPAYCSSNGSNTSDEWINKVILGSINNTSGNNGGYGNFTALSTTLSPGSTYTINLTPAFSGQTYTEYWRVWIDYNGDKDWSDAGEQVGQGFGTSAINITFTVPAGTTPDTARMRVSMQYNAYPPICGTFTWGEVEDYTIYIGSGPPPATCDDGIQNQGETGIDCGGPCEDCTTPGETIIHAAYFESGWDGWLDGGSDVARSNSSNSYEGSYSIKIADNSGTQSAMTSPTFNLSDATGVRIQFYFRASSMENGEDFWVRYNNGSGYVTLATFASGAGGFNNNTFYTATVIVPNFTPTTTGTFRIQCDASDNSDQVYIDQVTVTKTTGTGLIEQFVTIEELGIRPVVTNPSNLPDQSNEAKTLLTYPNPASDLLTISFAAPIQQIRIVTMEGVMVKVSEASLTNNQLDIQALAPGIYFLWIESEGKWFPTRFSKI